MSERFLLRDGIVMATTIINGTLNDGEENVIVLIAGGSASGKTSEVAKAIKAVFGEEALILSGDDYYFGKKYMKQQAEVGNVLNWDQPGAVNLAQLKSDLLAFRQGTPIPIRKYTLATGEATCDPTKMHYPKKVIIVEGMFVLDDMFADIEALRIFVDIGVHGRMIRRLMRDIKRTGQRPEDIVWYFTEVVEPMHEQYVQPCIKNADIVIENEYNPVVEAQRAGRTQSQIKFAAPKSIHDILDKIGADHLGSIRQYDCYLSPTGKNFAYSDEIMRIRHENDRFILTYKGPKDPKSSTIDRPIIEFQINDKTVDSLLDVYRGDSLVYVEKIPRVFYSWGGVVVSVDDVFINSESIGSFLEVRGEMEKIEPLLRGLDLRPENAIKKSYYEMQT